MLTFDQKIIATCVFAFSAAVMIFARRWRNDSKNAGYGIAGWAGIAIFLIWVSE